MLLALLTFGPMSILVLGSFMQRIGYFVLGFTLEHWRLVFGDPVFVKALRTTLTLALTAAVLSPLIFSVLAYMLVRTRLPGRRAGSDDLGRRRDSRHPRRAWAVLGVYRHARVELALRHDLGADYRRHRRYYPLSDAARPEYEEWLRTQSKDVPKP